MISSLVVSYIVAFIVLGWALNWLATAISFLVDLYHMTPELSRGLIACAAFSWVPYFVFVSGALHFTKWVLKRDGQG